MVIRPIDVIATKLQAFLYKYPHNSHVPHHVWTSSTHTRVPSTKRQVVEVATRSDIQIVPCAALLERSGGRNLPAHVPSQSPCFPTHHSYRGRAIECDITTPPLGNE